MKPLAENYAIPDIKPGIRANLVQEYYFSRKLKEISDMRKSGLDIINLGIGSPDMPPSANVIEALSVNALGSGNHGYQSYTGIPELRKAFASWYEKYFHVTLDPENEILPLVGSKEGIMHISMAFLNPGDEVLVPDPGYPAYEAAAKIAGGVVRHYDLKEENSWYPDIEKIESEGLEKVRLMWINYPHMPTGTKATPELLRSLVDLARRHNFLLCNDNPYSFILNNEHLSVLSIAGSGDVALELNSLSKSHNMAGWRIGMVAGRQDFISAILRIKSNMDSGMFQPLQAAAARALEADDEWYKSLNATYVRRRRLAAEIMKELSCVYNPDQTGLFLWGRIPSGYSGSEELSDNILYGANVFITPGSIFGANGKKYLRISLCATEKTLEEAKNRIVLLHKQKQG